MNYNHTQTGHLIIFALVVVILIYGGILTQTGLEPVFVVFMLFILFLVASFTSLNVTIDENDLRIKFGWGIHKKNFKLNEIISVKTVRNHWYYGWGIRLWLWPKMWIYNVSGFDAVEIKMKDNKIYRIGTDEPESLENSITQALNLKHNLV